MSQCHPVQSVQGVKGCTRALRATRTTRVNSVALKENILQLGTLCVYPLLGSLLASSAKMIMTYRRACNGDIRVNPLLFALATALKMLCQ